MWPRVWRSVKWTLPLWPSGFSAAVASCSSSAQVWRWQRQGLCLAWVLRCGGATSPLVEEDHPGVGISKKNMCRQIGLEVRPTGSGYILHVRGCGEGTDTERKPFCDRLTM